MIKTDKYKLDAKDKKILNLLQENARETLTNMSRKIGLSVDAIHNRIKKMSKSGLVAQRVMINPAGIGYPLITDVKIKMKNASEKDANAFISYLKNHPRVIELIQIMGDWDLTCVVIAKDANDLADLTNEIRYKFSKFIADWRALMVLKHHKFEEYDMNKL